MCKLCIETFWHNSADQAKEREVAQAKLSAALLEKDQVSSDLNGVERSFAELFKRLEKYKDVIEGYKKVRKCFSVVFKTII